MAIFQLGKFGLLWGQKKKHTLYKIRSGHQISFRNMSVPLLENIRYMLLKIGFNPSQISNFSVYLTRKGDLSRFRSMIGSKNPFKHKRLKKWAVGGAANTLDC